MVTPRLSSRPAPDPPASTDRVGLAWLITVRWTTLVAGVGAVVAGRSALGASIPVTPALVWLGLWSLSNFWLMWRVRRGQERRLITAAGALVVADVIGLSWLLLLSGGVLNPASVFYLVEIVMAALVLGRRWTWIVTALSVAGYAALFLAPTPELRDAQGMHPEIALHMRGMWIAFALTALLVAALVTRLVLSVERRDRALDEMRDRSVRDSRLASLATPAAGAAHELSTPLSTIAVAARELERTLGDRESAPELVRDARLVRREIDRCREILDALAAQSGELVGEAPCACAFDDVLAALRARLASEEWARIEVRAPDALSVVWPVRAVARALDNLVHNALQASPREARVAVQASAVNGHVHIAVIDRGTGIAPDELSRVGEPFFTTKPAGAGTGLGLFVTRSSIEQLGGSVSLQSTMGHGTTATIDLPVNVLASESQRGG